MFFGSGKLVDKVKDAEQNVKPKWSWRERERETQTARHTQRRVRGVVGTGVWIRG